jgi:membrane protein implicated in regulation of membrane protease activity
MSGWVIWAIVAVALAVGEIVTTGLFFLGPLALAAVAALIVAALGGGAAIQVVVFIVGSLATLGLLRPIARRHLRQPPQQRTGVAALAGSPALVVERVDASGGLVRLKGEVWSARAYLEDDVIEPGTRVHVVEIDGATALVQE